jgi:Kef-type K+ transport system membrane component KefB
MGTALVLSTTFAAWSYKTAIFFAASAVLIALAVGDLPVFFRRYANKVIEPEIKLLFFLLFALMSLAKWGESHAVLVVFVLGLTMSKAFRANQNFSGNYELSLLL